MQPSTIWTAVPNVLPAESKIREIEVSILTIYLVYDKLSTEYEVLNSFYRKEGLMMDIFTGISLILIIIGLGGIINMAVQSWNAGLNELLAERRRLVQEGKTVVTLYLDKSRKK